MVPCVPHEAVRQARETAAKGEKDARVMHSCTSRHKNNHVRRGYECDVCTCCAVHYEVPV